MGPKTPVSKVYQQDMGDRSTSERVVISGMSGLFPNSRHVKDFADILYKKKNPISSAPRWKYNHPEVSQYSGIVPNLESFDAQFFMVHYQLGNLMDAMSRKLLEQTYQAIYDAGMSPGHLFGKKVGVYIGNCFSESEKTFFYDSQIKSGFGIPGCSKSMFANRISYWLNLKGPSLSIDEACSSSIAALEQAYMAISRGDCEAAIVGSGNICLHPQSSVHYSRIMPISLDGKHKSFDINASGCVTSEAISVLFLQKAKNALRIYADVIHVKAKYNSLLTGTTGPKYGFYRDPVNMVEFFTDFYNEAGVSPQAVEYIEAFGSAIPEADKAELESLDAFFCKNRNKELLVGSVMSNIGYGEAASGISAVAKVILGYHNGILAANLNCDNPRKDVAALSDGRMRILTDHQSFDRTYAAVNSTSVTGIDAHVLLCGYYKPKDLLRYKCRIPHLVTISGRQVSSVEKILSDLKSRQVDAEELALLHSIHETKISGHLGRGFIILDTNQEQQTVTLCEKADYFDDSQRPLWFVYSGMGSQWAGMGTQLMRIPIFADAIKRCDQVLAPKGVDIIDIITSTDRRTFENILNSFVGIAAIQIGLTDILQKLDLIPDNIIGHSVGELGCAYADGCLTAEEMILAAYYRGLVSIETPFIRGSMAAVGIGYKRILSMCPPEIEVACHNGPDSCTISGPADIMEKFVAKLQAKQIFAKEVPCSNIAYHSKYISNAGPALLKYLNEVIKTPKLRTERWLSTSFPQERWHEPIAKFSSAEYHTNNLLSSVLFEETSRLIPPNAVTVEVAPHGLLQAILKRSLPGSCHHVPLTRRGHPDNAQYLLEAVGKLYMKGHNPKVHELYPKVEFPVSTGTPFLSHLIEWAHNDDWTLSLYVSAHKKKAASCILLYSIHDMENKYLTGNIVRDKNMFPFSAALVAVWDVLAMTIGVPKKQIPVQFDDLKFYTQPVLHDQRQLHLMVSIHRGNGYFEITENGLLVATGYIRGQIVDARVLKTEFAMTEKLSVKSLDVYQLLYKRGYDYRDDFRSIHRANKSLTAAHMCWQNNWVTLLEGMLHLGALRHPHESVATLTHIRRITIDTEKHHNSKIITSGNEKVMSAHVSRVHNVISCGGIVIEDVKFRELPLFYANTNLMVSKFVPFFQRSDLDISNILIIYLQIVAEKLIKSCINILEITDNKENVSYFGEILKGVIKMPSVEVHHTTLYREKVLKGCADFLSNVDILLVSNMSDDDKLCASLHHLLSHNTFIINKEIAKAELVKRPSRLYSVINEQCAENHRFELIIWRPMSYVDCASLFTLHSSSELALLTSTLDTLQQRHKLTIVTSYPPLDGLKEFVQTWRTSHREIYVFMMNELNNNEFVEQLPDTHVTFNILYNGKWGGEFLLPLKTNLSTKCDKTLQCSSIGDLDSLYWLDMVELSGPGIDVAVHYAALSKIDVQRYTEVCPFNGKQNNFGIEFSGVTLSGDRVMGLVNNGAVSSRVRARPDLLWPVPEYWTLEDAATVPLAYCLAFYCLCIRYELYRGMSVLVHGGAGALGQAVISIALGNGCKVFTTVSDVRKKKFLQKLFPELKDDQIGNSREHSFVDMALTASNGRGYDVVISSVRTDLKNMCLKCTAPFGILFDLELITTRNDFSFGMYGLTGDKSYSIINFLEVLSKENNDKIKKLQLLVSEGIRQGHVRPLSRVVYSPSQTPRAFRLLATSHNCGRALIQLQKITQYDLAPRSKLRLHCTSDLSHLILCNNNNFGLRIARRLIHRGAKKIYLHCVEQSAYFDFEIQSFKKFGVQVKVSREALKSKKDVITLVNDCIHLSQIEGVYVVRLDYQFSSEPFDVLQELDLTTRQSCPHLKYFLVASNETDKAYKICISRAQNKLPATLLKLPKVKKIDDATSNSHMETIDELGAINAFEHALRSEETVLIPHVHLKKSQSLLQEIATVAGIKLPDVVENSNTLSDFDLKSDKSQMICIYLRNSHNIYLLEEEIPNLTVKRIKNIEETYTDAGFKNTQGLATFYSYVDSDELLATTEMVFLPTQIQNWTMRDNEFDVRLTYLYIIPGLEGHYKRFRVLCKRLKIPAIVLQPGLEQPDETVSNIAQRYANTILKNSLPGGNFYLLGYESGTMTALEVAAILEDRGFKGTIFCIGVSPENIQIMLKKEVEKYNSDEELQIAIALHMCHLMVDNTDLLEERLRKATTWPERINVCVNSILGRVSHSAQYARELIECAYGRIKQFKDYKQPSRTLRSKIIFLKAASPDLGSDQSLQRYSEHPITVYQLRAPLAHSTMDLRCTAAINSHLNKDILSTFENKNLCETYLLNGDIMKLKQTEK